MIAEDERYIVFEDPLVIEMFQVLHERYPEFNRLKAEEWVKRYPETVIHGDFHSGNHMLGIGENEGEVLERYVFLLFHLKAQQFYWTSRHTERDWRQMILLS